LLQTADQNSACKHDIASKVKGKAITALAKICSRAKITNRSLQKITHNNEYQYFVLFTSKNKQSSMFGFDWN